MRFLTNEDVAVTRRLDDHIAVQRHLVLQLHITTLGSAVDLDPVAKINLTMDFGRMSLFVPIAL